MIAPVMAVSLRVFRFLFGYFFRVLGTFFSLFFLALGGPAANMLIGKIDGFVHAFLAHFRKFAPARLEQVGEETFKKREYLG